MSASSKSRSLCVNMTLPLWNKWHSCRVDCRAGLVSNPCQGALQENVAKGKKWCCWLCWIYQLIIFESKRWIIWDHLSMESNLWPLNIEMVSFTIRCVESNLCRIEMNNGPVCGIRFGWFFLNMQRPDCFVCVFSLPENMHRWVFFDEPWGFSVCFATHSRYSHLGSAVCYFMWIVFLFGCLTTKVQILMMRLNVAYTKVPCRLRRK